MAIHFLFDDVQALRVDVILYTRVGCHLCDDAAQTLRDHGLHPQCVDVDADPVLRERYNECVPVVVIDGKERFRGRVDALLLRRLLAAAIGGDRGEST